MCALPSNLSTPDERLPWKKNIENKGGAVGVNLEYLPHSELTAVLNIGHWMANVLIPLRYTAEVHKEMV